MPQYKLYYFDLKGRGEFSRLLFAYAGVEYEDIRISFSDWRPKKESMPYKQMPVLEVDGTKICQSLAIGRYLARQFGLTGKTALECAKSDEVAEATTEIMGELPWTEKDEEKKKELMRVAVTEAIPPMLKLIEQNMNGTYYVGEEITYGDIVFANGLDYILEHQPTILDETPKLKALYERVFAIPNIAKYVAKRPKSSI